jgi:hypothetical protein
MAATLNGAATEAAQQMLIAQALKNGKSPEQKRVIDFFFSQGKEGGCLSKSYNLTMDEYLKLVQDKVNNLNTKAKAIEKIGLDESEISEIEPIALASFVYDDDVHIKVEDGVAVSSQYALTWIFFSATQIYTYKYIFDTTSDNTWEFTNDFFYNDITCFSTSRFVKEKIDVVRTKGCLSSREEYVKNNYVVDKFEIIVPGTSYQFSMRYNENFDQSVQAAKAVLRAKKFYK